jgi:hypothetical protein
LQTKNELKLLTLSLIDIADEDDMAKGIYSPKFELVNLGEIMGEAELLVKELALQRNVFILVRGLDADKWKMVLDALRFKKVIISMIQHAINLSEPLAMV